MSENEDDNLTSLIQLGVAVEETESMMTMTMTITKKKMQLMKKMMKVLASSHLPLRRADVHSSHAANVDHDSLAAAVVAEHSPHPVVAVAVAGAVAVAVAAVSVGPDSVASAHWSSSR